MTSRYSLLFFRRCFVAFIDFEHFIQVTRESAEHVNLSYLIDIKIPPKIACTMYQKNVDLKIFFLKIQLLCHILLQ